VRRLVLMVNGLPLRQADRVSVVRGPAARVAFDPSGAPSAAALGFARAQGVAVDALQVREIDGGRYVVAEVRERGRPASQVLAEVLPRVVAGLAFPKTMRWQADGFRFGRPIRWVVAMLDRRVLPLAIAGVRAGRATRGHRFLRPAAVTLSDASGYAAAVRRGHVVLDPEARRARIATAATALARRLRGVPVIDADLLEELVWSTEHPTPLLGAFDRALAEALPREVVLVTLQHHQKSFGITDASGRVLPGFIAVRDGGTAHLDTVRTGHEWVVRARLEDARFFLDDDRRRGFEARAGELARLAHAAGLGSMADHVRRLEALCAWLAETAGLGTDERGVLARAAALCKVDLVTALVRELPELQGTVGRIYALEAGEPVEVASAIEQHYWPRAAGAALPERRPAGMLGVADRALLLVGALLAGLEPSGSQDPYGLRRAASGIAAILQVHGGRVGLRDLFAAAAARYDAAPDARARAVGAAVEVTLQRLRAALLEQGVGYDTADAVFAAGGDVVADLVARARALQAVRGDAAMPRLVTAFARASRILGQGQPAGGVDPALFDADAERALHDAREAAEAEVARAARAGRYDEALAALVRLADPIDRFFDEVLVMGPEPRVRANRLALLEAVTRTFLHVADLGKLAG
ncbi:MAG: glycine--tRNA ligase subunit beta, partial [Armatimonadota bacterium]|nr:glycine--tRNA ligase subunit beta [Armatimonadota bacterium]